MPQIPAGIDDLMRFAAMIESQMPRSALGNIFLLPSAITVKDQTEMGVLMISRALLKRSAK
ncbi:hypothetical protein [Mucilaginibacter pedocola]|nr:hypothetical protein [Mucilaginibacter pedocola]